MLNNDYVTESDRNRIINMPLFPSRGLIQLQDGTIIAENIVFQGIYINRKFIDSSGAQIELLYKKILQDRPKFSHLSNKGEFKEKIWLVDNLNEKELISYLDKIKTETLLSYGVYQIEADGLDLFEYVKGDQDSIMGLPIKHIMNYIKQYK